MDSRILKTLIVSFLFFFLPMVVEAQERQTAEIILNQHSIVPQIEAGVFAQPQGLVDENAPWLHVIEPLFDQHDKNSVKKEKKKRLMFNRRFYFELSQDSNFVNKVYRSGGKRWSFYNPYVHLEKGVWYWRYGVADPDTPDRPVWNKRLFSFRITGKEYKTPIPPKPEEVLKAVLEQPAPVFTLFRKELGHLLPAEWPELASWAKETAERLYAQCPPMSFTVSDEDAVKAKKVNKQGKITAKKVFYRMRMNMLMGQKSRYISNLMASYILTGETKYRDLAIKKTREQVAFFDKAQFYIESLGDTLVLKKEVWNGKPYSWSNFVDLCPEALTPEEIAVAVNEQYPDDWSCPEDFESAEHSVYDQHLWQEIIHKLKRPMTFARYTEKAREELKWAYELWLFRAPALGRNDGGSLEGDGYMGVHDMYLGTVPWVLYKLTGYNCFKSNRWYQNHAKYLIYMNPFGSTGNGYGDGDGFGSTMDYTTEAMAYMNPENEWNLLRYKMKGKWDTRRFIADLGKGDKAYAVLSIMNSLQKPDVSNVKLPRELAAVFKDIGEVAMHTNLEKKEKDFYISMHSSPYGSLMHTHPAQNAISVAYGGQDLFWKTGFYNGGPWHNLLSYKCSRAHNTIMADGMVQGFARSAYGWIPRFVSGDKISYAVGNASNAYNGENRYIVDKWKDENGQLLVGNIIPCLPEYGFGKPGVTKFLRHVLMLRPGYILIYDELEAEKPISWEFRLHSRRWMKQLDGNRLMAKNDYATASAQMFCNEPIVTSLKCEYLQNEEDGINPLTDIKPEDAWLIRPIDDENKWKNGFVEHYHGAFTTDGKFQKTRFLTIMQIHPGKNEKFKPEVLKASGKGLVSIELDGYTVEVQLDGNQPSFLQVHDKEGKAAFVTGNAATSLTLGGETKVAKLPGSTLLMEKDTYCGDIFKEEVDILPDMLMYGNLY